MPDRSAWQQWRESPWGPAFFSELERLELAVSDRAPYKHIARMFHLVCARR